MDPLLFKIKINNNRSVGLLEGKDYEFLKQENVKLLIEKEVEEFKIEKEDGEIFFDIIVKERESLHKF